MIPLGRRRADCCLWSEDEVAFADGVSVVLAGLRPRGENKVDNIEVAVGGDVALAASPPEDF